MSGIKHISTYGLSGLINGIVNFLFSSLLLSKLSNSDFNLYFPLIFVIEFMATLLVFGNDEMFNKFYSISNQILKNAFSHSISILLQFTVLLIIIGIWINDIELFEIRITRELYYQLVLNAFLLGLFRLFQANYSAAINSKTFFKLTIIRSVVLFILILCSTKAIFTLKLCLYFLSISYLVPIIFFLWKNSLFRSLPNMKIYPNFINFSYPLVFYSIFGLLSDYFSRIYLTTDIESSNLVSFNYSLQGYTLLFGITRAITKFWQPFSQKEMTAGNTTENKLYTLLIGFSIFNLIGVMVMQILLQNIDEQFKLYYFINNLKYAIFLIPFLILNLYIALVSSRFYFLEKTKLISTIVSISQLISILLTYFLIKHYGITGAIFGFSSGPVLHGILLFTLGRSQLSIKSTNVFIAITLISLLFQIINLFSSKISMIILFVCLIYLFFVSKKYMLKFI